MPLGERKIVVLPVFGSNFQMCPASMGCFVVARDVREGDVAEVDHAVGRDGDAFGEDEAAVEDLFELRVGRHDRVGGDGGTASRSENESERMAMRLRMGRTSL